ncbi:olfactory receptor 2K2-like [Ambystoma mexicanum]|uniref:olfactory receptor 2K2-like n=1 Tax=Ambystoma mexicanum TaxID=8296 RepID=UPI0037E99F40
MINSSLCFRNIGTLKVDEKEGSGCIMDISAHNEPNVSLTEATPSLQDLNAKMVQETEKTEDKIVYKTLMEGINQTQIATFILKGFFYHPKTKTVVFVLLLIVYLVTLTANILFILVTLIDTRLHSPMYFFLCNLSVLDLCYSSVSGPTSLRGLLVKSITISYSQCIAQMYLALSLGQTECFLMAVIALDRYVAICHPLRYHEILNTSVCIKLAIATWMFGFVYSLSSLIVLPLVDFCGHNVIDHTYCEAEAVAHLFCLKFHFIDIMTPVLAFVSLVSPISLILFTYFQIIATILRMPTAESRHRAFATCGSHLVVVTLFYGTLMGNYFMPKSRDPSEEHKAISIFYSLGVPALNPLIYTLRNKEVHRSIKKLYKLTKS